MVLQFVKLRTSLSHEDLMRTARERAPEFRAIDGLVQKYYVRMDATGQVGGVYLWDSAESMAAFRESKLAKTIAEAYQVVEPPEVEIAEVLFPLRETALPSDGGAGSEP